MVDRSAEMAKAVVLASAAASLLSLAAFAAPSDGSAQAPSRGETPTRDEQIEAGRILYAANCSQCHQADGTGVRDEVPPLAGSDFLAKGPERAIAVVLHGLKGELRVHGRSYDSAMPQLFQLSNEEVADVLTFVYNSWGNPGGEVRASEVAAQRYDRALAPEPGKPGAD